MTLETGVFRVTDRQTDRQTEMSYQHRTLHDCNVR